jgi:hypothetical protein
MEFNEYELHVVARRRLAELRAAAAERAMVAALNRGGAGLRARIGQALVRLGHCIDGRAERADVVVDANRPSRARAGAFEL